VTRRAFITLLGGAAAAWPLAALGQQQPAKLARIGFLRAAGPDNKDFTAFRSGLRALGYVEGQNIVIEQRYAAGSYDRVGELAAELVRLNVDVKLLLQSNLIPPRSRWGVAARAQLGV
jgi:putative tryptophan/tyrosine transport system substrate-binding protein